MTELIEPYKSGEELTREITDTSVDGPGVSVWWMGQSGYVLKSREATIGVDLYLSEHLTKKYAHTEKPHVRMTRSPLRPSELIGVDLIISTHKHSDHMDPETVPELMNHSPEARYLIPRAHRDHVAAWGIDMSRVIKADVDRPVKVKGVRVVPKPAAHVKFDYIEGVGYPHMTFRIEMGGMTLFHGGDTVPYRGMCGSVDGADVAFLPINGRDARRVELGTPGNTSIDDALCIAVLAGAGILVPHHYEMFTFNTVDIAAFEERARIAYPDQKVRILECGRKYMFTP